MQSARCFLQAVDLLLPVRTIPLLPSQDMASLKAAGYLSKESCGVTLGTQVAMTLFLDL